MVFTSRRLQRNQRLSKASNNAPPLKRNDSDEAVEILQQALIDLGFDMPHSTKKSVVPDGIFGAETEQIVKAFQATTGLIVDGVAGEQTLTHLDRLFTMREGAAQAGILAEAHTAAPLSPWYLS